jgi:hypothetical protein
MPIALLLSSVNPPNYARLRVFFVPLFDTARRLEHQWMWMNVSEASLYRIDILVAESFCRRFTGVLRFSP